MSVLTNIESAVKTDAAAIGADVNKVEVYTRAEVDKLIADVKTKTVAVSYWVFPLIAVGGYIAISLAIVLLKHFV